MRRRRPPARARPPTTPTRRRRRPTRPTRQTRASRTARPRTPSGGWQAHARAPPCYCAPRARWPARTCVVGTLPPRPPPPTPCSRYKCRGARAWSGWARRGGRAYGTTTGITIPHWNGKDSRSCRRWWGVSRRWWSRRRARGPPPRPSGSAYRPAYVCPTASTARTHTCNCEPLISKTS